MSKKNQISISDGDLKIIIEGDSSDFFGQDIYIKAITKLIEDADISGWDKHNNAFNSQEKFNILVLKALIFNNAIDLPDGLSYKDVLLEIIDSLDKSNALNESIIFDSHEDF